MDCVAEIIVVPTYITPLKRFRLRGRASARWPKTALLGCILPHSRYPKLNPLDIAYGAQTDFLSCFRNERQP